MHLFWLWEMWDWLTTQSVIPWTGIIAAIGVALSIRARDWLKSLGTFISRALQAVAIWLSLVVLLGTLGSGGTGGAKGNSKASGDNTEKSPVSNERQIAPPISSSIETSLLTGSPEFDLTIRFVPSAANPSLAQEFACDLIITSGSESAKQVNIREKNMENFQASLVKELRSFRTGRVKPKVQIESSLSPGQSVLRQMSDRIRIILEDCEISVGAAE